MPVKFADAVPEMPACLVGTVGAVAGCAALPGCTSSITSSSLSANALHAEPCDQGQQLLPQVTCRRCCSMDTGGTEKQMWVPVCPCSP